MLRAVRARMGFVKYAAILALAATAAFAADPVGQAFDSQISGVEREFVSLAEAMPAAAFNFAPAAGEFKGVRTFSQQIKHVAAVNYMVAAALLVGSRPSMCRPRTDRHRSIAGSRCFRS